MSLKDDDRPRDLRGYPIRRRRPKDESIVDDRGYPMRPGTGPAVYVFQCPGCGAFLVSLRQPDKAGRVRVSLRRWLADPSRWYVKGVHVRHGHSPSWGQTWPKREAGEDQSPAGRIEPSATDRPGPVSGGGATG